jgi:hypothetical protein
MKGKLTDQEFLNLVQALDKTATDLMMLSLQVEDLLASVMKAKQDLQKLFDERKN